MPRDALGRLIKRDWWGRKIPKKQLRREVLAENIRRGKQGEFAAQILNAELGATIQRTGKGSDFKKVVRDPFTGKVLETQYLEVKTGKSKLSRLQRAHKKRSKNYKVVRF